MVGYTHIRYLPFSDPEPTCGRAVGTLLKVSGINDMYRLYLQSIHDNLEFRFIAIPKDYQATTDEQFNDSRT